MNIGKLTKPELIDLGNKLLSAEGEKKADELYNEFNRQFSHPDLANLFFYPENYNARNSSLSKYEPTVEEIVEIGLNHKPVAR